MAVEPYDWQRDYGLDFPDDPSAEPTTDEVKERIAHYEQTAYLLDDTTGVRNG